MHEYAFDIKMFAVVRVKASNRVIAEKILAKALDYANLDIEVRSEEGDLVITEASIHIDDVEYPYLFEFDGEMVDYCDAIE